MDIVKKDSFRSKGNDVRQCDDMYRVVIDMSRIEYAKFTQWKSESTSKERETLKESISLQNKALQCLKKEYPLCRHLAFAEVNIVDSIAKLESIK